MNERQTDQRSRDRRQRLPEQDHAEEADGVVMVPKPRAETDCEQESTKEPREHDRYTERTVVIEDTSESDRLYLETRRPFQR